MDANNINFLVTSMMILVVPVLLSTVLMTLPIQIAKGQDQADVRTNTKQLIHQQTACKGRETNCHPTAINIICMKGSVCHIGYDAPLLLPTP